MPATSFQALTFDDALSTTVNEHRKEITDNLYRSSATLNLVTQGGTKEVLDGGARIVEPLLLTRPAGFSSYSGTDTISTTINQKFDSATYEWTQVGGSIGITGTQEIVNSGKAGVIKLVKAAIEAGKKELRDKVNDQLMTDGSGNAGKDIGGLPLIISTAATTVGGLSETTYTAWANQRPAAIAAFGSSMTTATGGYYGMMDLWSTLTDGEDHPDLILMAREIFLSYCVTLGQNVRFMQKDDKLWGGWYGAMFMGAPAIVERNANIGTYAADTAKAYFINSKYLKFVVHRDRNFIVEPFQKPINQDARFAKLLMAGQLVCNNRRMQGVLQVNAV